MGFNARKVALAGFALWVVVMVVAALSSLAHGAISSKHDNSYGAVIYQDNPYTYMYGSIVTGNYVEYKPKLGTNIRFQPYHTFSLFTSEVLFCGDQGPAFNSMTGPIVVTYETRAHETVGGIGCHALIGVNRVIPTQRPE